MFKKIIISIAMLMTFNATASQKIGHDACSMFDESQIETMREAWFEGADRGYGWTLAAIAWQESSAGKNLVNMAGPAYGVYHNLLSSVSRRHGIKNKAEQVKLAAVLVSDSGRAAQEAMLELDYWKFRHKGNMDRVIASYYAGNNWMHSGGQGYLKIIKSKIKFLQKNGCLQ